MRLTHWYILAILVVLVGCAAPSVAYYPTGTIALSRISVVDVISGAVLPDQNVIIREGRIVAAGGNATTPIPRSAVVIDGRGKYAIPGLWDMHVHTIHSSIDFPLELANGITGIRDMGGVRDAQLPPGNLSVVFDSLRTWREQIRHGLTLGPRIIAGGVLIDGPDPVRPSNYSVKNAAHARILVDSLKRERVDFIKVYQNLPLDIYQSITEEARRLGLPVSGHLSDFVKPAEAVLRQRTIEHVEFNKIVFDSAAWAALPEEIGRAATPEKQAEVLRRLHATFSAQRLIPLAESMRKNGVWSTPTLVFFPGSYRPPDSTAAGKRLLEYIPTHVRVIWEISSRNRFSTKELVEIREEAVGHALQKARILHERGVRILAGSDAWNRGVVPGFSLHQELMWLTRAGLSPLQALQSATMEPARYLEATDSLGSVAAGKVADVVVLDASPLDDIRNTQRITSVIVRGKLLTRSRLDSLLRSAKVAVVSRSREERTTAPPNTR